MLQPVEGELVPEIGYHIVRREWGRGYATEAATACRDLVLGELGFERVVSIVAPENLASRRVAEKVHETMREFTWEKSGRAMCLFESRTPARARNVGRAYATSGTRATARIAPFGTSGVPETTEAGRNRSFVDAELVACARGACQGAIERRRAGCSRPRPLGSGPPGGPSRGGGRAPTAPASGAGSTPA